MLFRTKPTSRAPRTGFLRAAPLLLALLSVIPFVSAAQRPAIGLHYGSDFSISQYDKFGAWLGRAVKYRVTFVEMHTWSDIAKPPLIGVSKKWVNSRPGRVEVLSVPLLPGTVKKGNFQVITSGAHDHHFRALAKKLKQAGIARKVIIRLGWEGNGGWYRWSYLKNPAGFKAAWRRVVKVMRSEAPNLRFEFNISNIANRDGGAKWSAGYPGDDVVDVISMDIYDHWNSWDRMKNGDGGLAEMRKFAIAHNKPEAYAEWSCSTTKNGHGDNPEFVTKMANWMNARPGKVLYHSYWNTRGGAKALVFGANPMLVPKAAARYKKLFGPTSSTAKVPASSTAEIPVKLTFGDIGSPKIKGGHKFDGTNIKLRAGGYDIYNKRDEFHFGHQALNGDVELTVHVSQFTGGDAWTKAGLMLRSSTAANSAYVGVFLTRKNGIVLQWRDATGAWAKTSSAISRTAPRWVRLMRDGNKFYAFFSGDGAQWHLVDFVTVKMPAKVRGGIALCSHVPNKAATAWFKGLEID